MKTKHCKIDLTTIKPEKNSNIDDNVEGIFNMLMSNDQQDVDLALDILKNVHKSSWGWNILFHKLLATQNWRIEYDFSIGGKEKYIERIFDDNG